MTAPRRIATAGVSLAVAVSLNGCVVTERAVDTVELHRKLGTTAPQRQPGAAELQRLLDTVIVRCSLPFVASMDQSALSRHASITYTYRGGDLTLHSETPGLQKAISDCLPPLSRTSENFHGTVEIWPAP